METFYCEKCNRTMNIDNFYTSNNLEKYKHDGKIPICKKCMTSRVDNWDPDTFLWILQEVDVPYVPKVWDDLLAKYAKDRTKVTGMTILGRYLSSMKLKQWKEYRWADNDFIQELENHKLEEAMKKQGYAAAQIAAAVDQNTHIMPAETLAIPDRLGEQPQTNSHTQTTDYFQPQEKTADDLGLTEEDVLALRLKWGATYRPEEWVQLEKLYTEMMDSYDIQTAGHIDTLKKVCKTSLKADQLLDIGDIDGAQKAIKMYDMLMKSGKFTAAQNKAESGEFVDSISELVLVCEKDGFIPRYYTDGPQDKVDYVIRDFQDYVTTLVKEELQLGPLIERSIKQIEEEREAERQAEVTVDDEDEEERFERELFEKKDESLTDDDFVNFNEFLDESEEDDKNLYNSLFSEKGE